MTTLQPQKVISAKDTNDGEVVYLTSCDAWTPDVSIAELLSEEDFGWRLAFAQRLREVVDATLIDAREGAHGLSELVAA
ncbi:MAG: hypothetical protein COA53_12800 [Rhodobacteraceae bacterium]|nr:MAG: hypothetical protein COA53_12800 [Paracoccaceae bacterium]